MKGIKVKKAMKEYVDYDYIKGVRNEDGELVIRAMEESEVEYLKEFTDNEYCNGHYKENSLFKRSFGEKYESVKTELIARNNGVDDDTFSHKMMNRVDFEEDKLGEDHQDEVSDLLNKMTPPEVVETLIKEAADEIHTEPREVTEDILREHSLKVLALYILLKKDVRRQKRRDQRSRSTKKKKGMV